MQAVILAAGQGTRIREHHILPKGFIEIDNKPLILHSLDALRGCGVERILVVTGYASEHYENLAATTVFFDTIYNPYYAPYSNLYSLYLTHEWVQDDVLILESDIIFEPRALNVLLKHPLNDVVLASNPSGSNDEVYVEVDVEGNLSNMSKKLDTLNKDRVLGEFVGLSKLSLKTFKHYMTYLESQPTLLKQGYYDEDGFVSLGKKTPLHCELVKDLLWSEIDNVEQLNFAERIYPQMNRTIEVQNV